MPRPNDRDTQARIEALERQVASLAGATRPFGIRKRSASGVGPLPWYDIALGPDLARGEWRGHARGVLAIGDLATGVIALGGLARGIAAFGGLAFGLVGVGGLAIGLITALGGAAIGTLAIGGGAAGGVAVGGAAAGYYACGGAAIGPHTVSALHVDPEAQRFFDEYTGRALCGPPAFRPRAK